MARLTADFWVAAYRARLEALGIPVYVSRRGDPTAGAVLVKLATLDGLARLFGRMSTLEGAQRWEIVAEGAEREVDEAAARAWARDPDLWLVELEDRQGRHLLDEEGFAG
jgi:hypothetical protein